MGFCTCQAENKNPAGEGHPLNSHQEKVQLFLSVSPSLLAQGHLLRAGDHTGFF